MRRNNLTVGVALFLAVTTAAAQLQNLDEAQASGSSARSLVEMPVVPEVNIIRGADTPDRISLGEALGPFLYQYKHFVYELGLSSSDSGILIRAVTEEEELQRSVAKNVLDQVASLCGNPRLTDEELAERVWSIEESAFQNSEHDRYHAIFGQLSEQGKKTVSDFISERLIPSMTVTTVSYQEESTEAFARSVRTACDKRAGLVSQ